MKSISEEKRSWIWNPFSVGTQSLNQGQIAKEPPISLRRFIDFLSEQLFQAEHLDPERIFDAKNTCVYEISFVETVSRDQTS